MDLSNIDNNTDKIIFLKVIYLKIIDTELLDKFEDIDIVNYK